MSSVLKESYTSFFHDGGGINKNKLSGGLLDWLLKVAAVAKLQEQFFTVRRIQ